MKVILNLNKEIENFNLTQRDIRNYIGSIVDDKKSNIEDKVINMIEQKIGVIAGKWELKMPKSA